MIELKDAIAQLEREIEQLGFPGVGTALWWMLRAKSHGLSLLKTLQVRGVSDPVIAESFRKKTRLEMQAQVVE